MKTHKYLILGGGIVAGYAAQEFVEQGIDPHELAIVSADDALPYERPPLSKDFLAGDETKDEILINPADFYDANDIDVYLNTRANKVDLGRHHVYTDAGEGFRYDKLIIATGSHIRTLDVPGGDLDNLFYLRWIDDARDIPSHMLGTEHAVVIGGGFIGMEVASVLADKDVRVTLVFRHDRPLADLFTEEMSDYFRSYYEARGVTFLPRSEVKSFALSDEGIATNLMSGQSLTSGIAVAGIGVEPAVELFEESSLQVDDGIVVNEYLETNVTDVYAAGDVTNYWDVVFAKRRHIEHWDNAMQQGKHVAQVVLGQRQPFVRVPYFFSDAFDLSWEFWGDNEGADEVVYRGDVASGSFSTWWLQEGRVVAAFVMDRPDEERQLAQEWIEQKQEIPAAMLADESEPLHMMAT